MRHGPATLDNLILAVSKIIKNLRKASGGKYKENLAKSVKGLLYSKPVF